MIDDWIDNPNPDGAVCYDAINGRHVMWSGGCDRAFHVGCESVNLLTDELFRDNDSVTRNPVCAGCEERMELDWRQSPPPDTQSDPAFQNHYL